MKRLETRIKSIPQPIWLAPILRGWIEKPLHRSLFLLVLHQVICPSGGRCKILSSPRAKNKLLPFFGNTWFTVAIPPCQEGRIAIVTNVGWDAVDAGSATDERVVCGRRSRVVLAPRSRRQVRVTPTRRADDGVNKAVVPGESAE